MKHFHIGLLSADKEGREFLAKFWGKKGTTSDISIYTVQNPELLQTTIVPEGYPKKPLPLVITAHMSDLVILGISKNGIDQNVGEAAILADCLNLKGIRAVIGPNVTGLNTFLEQSIKVFSKLNIPSWDGIVISDGKTSGNAREKLSKIYTGPRGNPDEYLAIEVDHSFPVQGVGSVILGTVTNGTVQKGQKIVAYPSSQVGQVRSIQVNDVDEREAGPGVHVGLAIKGILPKFLERGTIIANPDDKIVHEINKIENLPIKKSAFGSDPKKGSRIHVISGLFDSPGEVVSWGEKITVKLDKQIPYHDKIRLTVVNLDSKPFVLGSKLN